MPQDERFRFGGGGGTLLHPVAVAILLIAIILVFLLPRKYLIGPLLATAILIPLRQEVVIVGLHFTIFRILVFFGWVRLIWQRFLIEGQRSKIRIHSIDKALVLWVISSVVTFTILWSAWQAFINRMGLLYNAFGIYFLLRFLIRDREDINRTIKTFAIICGIVALFMLNEQVTGRNLFAMFGGVPEFTLVREGRLRSQAAFGHAILAGTFGATLLPLFVGQWWQDGKSRIAAMLGIISATVITITSVSSTPAIAYVAGIIGLCMWHLRKHMRMVRWGIVAALVGLHIVMKAPVWALIARVDVVGGSSAYHRFELVDHLIRRFSDWWLLGTKANREWGWAMWDVANQYVDAGQEGGLLTLIFFIAIISLSFKRVGAAREASQGNTKMEWLLWALGASLFSHVVAFMGISYFDQTIVAWYAALAMISAVTLAALPQKTVAQMRGRSPELGASPYRSIPQSSV